MVQYCIQCGYMRDLVSVVDIGQPILVEKKRQIRDEYTALPRGSAGVVTAQSSSETIKYKEV